MKSLLWYRFTLGGVLLFLLILVFVGAVVRATGAGLGCPDWPRCWGALIPPWSVEQVNLEKLDFEKFKLKAERLGRNPDEVTPETILSSFNPVHTWTEFINRLVSIPIGLFSLASVVLSFCLPKRKDRWLLQVLAVVSLLIILINAWMGRQIVYSGLKPGIITTHLALAMGLIGLLVWGRWLAFDKPVLAGAKRGLFFLVAALFALVITEGIMGAQVREMTDELAKDHVGEDRASWIEEIEQKGVYLIHRSFSWLIVVAMFIAYFWSRKLGIVTWRVNLLLSLVIAMMVMGVILANVSILPLIQVLHVGAAALMVTFICDWLFRLSGAVRRV